MDKKQIYATIVTVLLCTACGAKQSLDPALVATAEYLEVIPLPLPEFVLDFGKQPIENAFGGFPEAACISIGQYPIWEEGVQAEELQQQIHETLQLTVDGQPITEETYSTFFIATLISHLDGSGSWGGDGAVCFNTEHLAVGLHIATVEITSVSGVIHSYEWAFRKSENTQTPPTNPTAEYLEQNPLPTPAFLVGTNASGEMPVGTVEICISIDQTMLRSDTSAHFTIDGQTIDNVESWFAGGRLDAPVGYATYATHCVDVANPSLDLHVVTVELTTTSNEQYTYSWAVRVTEEILTVEPPVMPTLAILPSLTPSSTP